MGENKIYAYEVFRDVFYVGEDTPGFGISNAPRIKVRSDESINYDVYIFLAERYVQKKGYGEIRESIDIPSGYQKHLTSANITDLVKKAEKEIEESEKSELKK